jgi:hypothetical protein
VFLIQSVYNRGGRNERKMRSPQVKTVVITKIKHTNVYYVF